MYRGRKETNFGLYVILLIFSGGLPVAYGVAWIWNITDLAAQQSRFDDLGSTVYYYLIQTAFLIAYVSVIFCCIGMSRDSLKAFLWDNRFDLYRYSRWYFVFALISAGVGVALYLSDLADAEVFGLLLVAAFCLLLYTIIMYLSAEALKPDEDVAGEPNKKKVEVAEQVPPKETETIEPIGEENV